MPSTDCMGGLWLWFVLFLLLATAGCTGGSSSYTPQPYVGTKLDGGMAPDFRLVDQRGIAVALSDFRSKVVVLAFMDPKCRAACPLTAFHLRKAYQQLGIEEAASVVFLGVNVNAEANGVADMAEATEEWHLAEVPAWHLLTGNPEDLEPVWKAYAIAVVPAPEEGGEMLHTPGVYLIDQAGRKRWYVSPPFDETATLSELLVKHIGGLIFSRNLAPSMTKT